MSNQQAALDNRANQLNPNHQSFCGRRSSTSERGERHASSDNHSNQLNPNNEAYWQARGLSRRADWKREVERKRDAGCFEHRANQAAARSESERRAAGAATRAIEAAVRAAVGSDSHLRKAGSVMRHTDTRRSDLDLAVETKQPMTREQFHTLARESSSGPLAASTIERRRSV